MFLLVPAYPGCPGSKAVKRSSSSLLLLSYSLLWITLLVLDFGIFVALTGLSYAEVPFRNCSLCYTCWRLFSYFFYRPCAHPSVRAVTTCHGHPRPCNGLSMLQHIRSCGFIIIIKVTD